MSRCKPEIMEGARKNFERFSIDFELWAVSLHALGDAISCLSVVNISGFSLMALRLQHCRVIPLHTDQIFIEGESFRAQKDKDKKE